MKSQHYWFTPTPADDDTYNPLSAPARTLAGLRANAGLLPRITSGSWGQRPCGPRGLFCGNLSQPANDRPMPTWAWIVAWYALASVATLAAFAWDKLAARGGRRRIPEQTLHVMELLGGWPGAIVAILWLRHKSSKAPFLLVTFAIMAIHLAAIGAWLMK